MTCDEFQRVLPELEGGHNLEQQQHVRSCPTCAELLADLSAITHEARLLEDAHEPSPNLWNSIETALRQEGLIRQPVPELVELRLPSRSASTPRWRFAWLVPLAAAALFGSVLLVMHQRVNPVAQQPMAPPAVAAVGQQGQNAGTDDIHGTDDIQLLSMVSAQAPALRASYESDLKAVDAYIRDAEFSAQKDPNDEIAQQYLMNAYEQRAMIYEMAMERSVP
ncbi:MAG TPA: anti-sigma factor [Terriglobales bacterium]|nr:anti-sigma factor [Terriglobales bacterium]